MCVCVGCITNKLFNTAHKTLSHSAMTEQKSCRQAEGEEKEREGKRASGGEGSGVWMPQSLDELHKSVEDQNQQHFSREQERENE